MTLHTLETSLEESKQKLEEVKNKYDKLSHRVGLMKPGSVCPDLLEEQAKQVLGYTHEGEKVVSSNNSRQPTN